MDLSVDWAGVSYESLSAIAVRCMAEDVAVRFTAQAAVDALSSAEFPARAGGGGGHPTFPTDAASWAHTASSHRLDGTSAATVYFEWK